MWGAAFRDRPDLVVARLRVASSGSLSAIFLLTASSSGGASGNARRPIRLTEMTTCEGNRRPE
eukprot:15152958-Alexandrium_andersonii.AAC.1